jgi:hypothetical protein
MWIGRSCRGGSGRRVAVLENPSLKRTSRGVWRGGGIRGAQTHHAESTRPLLTQRLPRHLRERARSHRFEKPNRLHRCSCRGMLVCGRFKSRQGSAVVRALWLIAMLFVLLSTANSNIPRNRKDDTAKRTQVLSPRMERWDSLIYYTAQWGRGTAGKIKLSLDAEHPCLASCTRPSAMCRLRMASQQAPLA